LRKRGRGRDTERRSETEDDHGNAVHGRFPFWVARINTASVYSRA
jgi:hypothetical protein